MSDAYAAAGVDTDQADLAVGALVGVLKRIELGRPSLSVVPSGHYASVLRVSDELGIAISTDGVGSKLVIAEQTGRLDTVGIDCIAMNVNDLVCVGAEPIAMVDYLAVEQADPTALAQIAEGLRIGAMDAGVEIPGGELAVIPELIRGHPSPGGFDLCGTAIGTVALDSLVLGDRIQAGDALIGLPSSGVHSNGYTLARRVLADVAHDDARLGRALGEILLEPTTIYVRAVLELLASDADVRGLAHITGDGINNLSRLRRDVVYDVSDPLPVPPIFELIQDAGEIGDAEMQEVFNMGMGFVCVVPEADADAAIAVLASHHPGTRVVGSVRM